MYEESLEYVIKKIKGRAKAMIIDSVDTTRQ